PAGGAAAGAADAAASSPAAGKGAELLVYGEIDLDQACEDGGAVDSDAMPAGGLADPSQATRKAIDAEQWTRAQKCAEEWIRQDALSMEAVEKLIEISEVLQDNPKIVRGLILHGDLCIRDGNLQEALPVFKRVLEIDPENTTAQRRMKRFRELGLDSAQAAAASQAASDSKPTAPGADNPGLVQQVLEASDAVVAVRDVSMDGDKEQQGWMDIGALLEEFHEGLRGQVDSNDAQAHYDLGVSHMEMGLFEEAIDKFDEALGCGDVPSAFCLRIRELRAKCFSKLERHREAIHELQLVLESLKVSPGESAGLRYMLAVEYHSVGELNAAKECLCEVLQAKPDLKEAAQLLSSMEDEVA
ncbi:MAG: hypothetical protein KAY24_12480, partial [Candidatus Eisenbacteria sp.]|nr:hypothetical protein [Candidatus Eisenbacteria bacterium]